MKNKLIQKLKSEHEEIKQLFQKAEDAPESDRKSCLEDIEMNLIPHARGEEKMIYSLNLERSDEKEKLEKTNEAYEEHKVADEILSELKKIDVSDPRWKARLSVLKENVTHHIEEEEEEFFKSVEKNFDRDELDELYNQYESIKQEFEEKLPTQSQISERSPEPEAAKVVNG